MPGCATGEEAYAIAILLLEEAARRDIRPQVQVFGSDLDVGGLAVAREGRYPIAIEVDVSKERLRRFFSREGDHRLAKRELRDMILFASHSLLKDPPFSPLDLISCRNLLIYLDRELQQGMSRSVLKFARQASLVDQARRPWLAVQGWGWSRSWLDARSMPPAESAVACGP